MKRSNLDLVDITDIQRQRAARSPARMSMRRCQGLLLSLAVGALSSGCAVEASDGDEEASIGDASAALMTGAVQLYAARNFSGRTASFDVDKGTIADSGRLAAAGLHNAVGSLSLFGVPSSGSVFVFEHEDASGRFVSVTGNATSPVMVPELPHLYHRASVVWVADHGSGSIRIPLQALADRARNIPLPQMRRVSWRQPTLRLRPMQGFADAIVEGEVRVPFPLRNRKVRITVHIRPEVSSPTDVRFVYAGYERDIRPCWSNDGPICGPMAQEIDRHMDSAGIQHQLDESLNNMLMEAGKRLSALTCPGGSLGVRRVNVLPTAIEFVVAETETERGCLEVVRAFVPDDGLSLDRPAGMVSTGIL
ncbi:hypothetical protein [Sorangium cellulosum]|nr:hypothetical protein [Sorangium cellulosum]